MTGTPQDESVCQLEEPDLKIILGPSAREWNPPGASFSCSKITDDIAAIIMGTKDINLPVHKVLPDPGNGATVIGAFYVEKMSVYSITRNCFQKLGHRTSF